MTLPILANPAQIPILRRCCDLASYSSHYRNGTVVEFWQTRKTKDLVPLWRAGSIPAGPTIFQQQNIGT